MNPELQNLTERTAKATTAHERTEIALDLKDIAGDDAITFLLLELRGEHYLTKSQEEILAPIFEVGHDRFIQFACGIPLGGSITQGIADFLKRYVEHNRPMLEEAKAADDERIRQSNEEGRRLYKEGK